MARLIDIIQTGEIPATDTVDQCPFCQSPKTEFLFWNFDRLYHLPGKFGTLRCEECGLIRLSPRPTVDAISVYYPDDYGAYVKPAASAAEVNLPGRRFGTLRRAVRDSVLSGMGYDVGKIAGWQKTLSPLLTKYFKQQATYDYGERFPHFVPNGKALEVGCGTGKYLNFLKYHGWDVTGADLSGHAAIAAKKNFDIDVFCGQLQDSPFADASFDYIHLSHVVEHFYDPLETLRKVRSLLKPDGIAYIEVPNAEGAGAQISGEYWYGWDAPRHLFTFTPKTLRAMVERVGMSVTKMTTKIWDSFDWAETYAQEEKALEKLPGRPAISTADPELLARQRRKAEDIKRRDPLAGDNISCWVTPANKAGN